MKKRVLAVLMALCITSINTMGAFAAALENSTDSQVAVEESIMDEKSQAASDDVEVTKEEPEGEVTEESEDLIDKANESDSSDLENSDEGNSSENNEEEEKMTASQEEETSSDDENGYSDESESEGAQTGESQSDGSGAVQNDGDIDPGNDKTDVTGLEEEIPMSGKCGAEGDNLTWELSGSDDGLTLTISGSGEMADYSEEMKAPWSENAANIRYLILNDAVTSIGSYAFADCSIIEEVIISEDVHSIGENAFYNCNTLTVIRYQGTKEAWDQINHSELPDITELFYDKESETEVNAIALNETEIKIAIGEQFKLVVTFDPEDATDKDVVWASSDDEVAMVDDTGFITANSIGTAIITVSTANGKSAECKVEVERLYYNISYVLYGGTNAEENPATYTENDSVDLLKPVREGYVFDGWFSDVELTQEVKGIAAGETGDKVFYAKWTGKTYKIVFNGNTADSGKMPTISYTVGKTPSLPVNAFAKKEYVFTGWNTKSNGKGTGLKNRDSLAAFDAANGSTVTLYAQWKIKDYSIVYKLNGGINNKLNPVTYNFKTAVTSLAKPTRKGYVFQGWYTDAKLKTPFEGIKKGSKGNKTVYAKWKIVKYTITYTLNGGIAPKGNPSNYYVTTATIKLKNPTKKGYTFEGWYKDNKFKSKVTSITKGSAGNLKLYAKWRLTDYQIIYVLNGGKNNKTNPATYQIVSKTFKLANPSKKGYRFAGWFLDAKFTKKFTSITQGSIGKKTVYAKWTKVTYTIKYNLNGGTVKSPNPEKYTVTTNTIVISKPQKKGYLFEGWYTDSGFHNRIEEIKKGSAGNLTLYAKWKVIKYNISYIIDNGDNSKDNPETYTVNTAVELKEPVMKTEREGFVFRGWYSDPECTNKVTQIKKGTIGDKTFYAKWSYIGFSQFPDKVLAGEGSIDFDINTEGNYSFQSSNNSVLTVDGSKSVSLSPKKPGIAQISLIKNNEVIDTINIRVMDYSNAKVVAKTYYRSDGIKDVNVTMNMPSTTALYVGDERRLKSVTIIKEGRKVQSLSVYSVAFESSNSSIVEVSSFDNLFFTANKSGKCTVTLKGKYNLEAKLTINVKDKVKTPYIVEQGKVKSGGFHSMAYCNSVTLDIKGYESGEVQEIEIYRSTSKNSGYKKVVTSYYDKGLKPNTCYFYKARIKLQKQNVFGPFSKPVAYWTAPKGHYDWFENREKMKYNKSSHTISWPKISGATGYIVAPYYSWFRGYNIFGQELYANTIEVKTTKNTSMNAWKAAATNYWPLSIKAVVPYAVHNGYVYAEGYRITNSIGELVKEVKIEYQ